jgi:hypothetical protein
MGFLSKLSSWWNKDDLARAEEETHMTQAERDVAEEDYEGRKEDIRIESGHLGLGSTDYESDSKPPRY